MVERQSCKLKVLGSIPSEGCKLGAWTFGMHMPSLVIALRVTLHLSSHALLRMRYQVHVVLVRLQPNTCHVDSVRGCTSSRRAFALATEDLRR